VTSSFHARLSYIYIYIYIYAILKILFPCPNAIPVTDKILTNFSLFVGLTIGIVLLPNTAVFWCASKGPYRSVCNETHTYQSLSHCFHEDWAVLVAVSVPQQPKNYGLNFSSFCTSVSVSLLALYSKHSLFHIFWD